MLLPLFVNLAVDGRLAVAATCTFPTAVALRHVESPVSGLNTKRVVHVVLRSSVYK